MAAGTEAVAGSAQRTRGNPMQLRLEARRLVLALMPLRELASRIAGVERDEFGHDWPILRGLRGPLKVGRAFSHLFRPT